MSIVDKILKEGKQRGILYHYTNFRNLISILSTNHLRGYYNHGFKLHGVSTTRNKNFHDINRKAEGITGISVRIELDGDKLSDKYKIIPYNYYYQDTNKARIENTESEELIITKANTNVDKLGWYIDNIKNYILNASLFPEKEIEGSEQNIKDNIIQGIDKLEEENIPYWIDDIWADTIEEIRQEQEKGELVETVLKEGNELI